MTLLEVRLDSIAAIRSALGRSVDPVSAAVIAELGGVDSVAITLTEKEDFVRLRDLYVLQDIAKTRFNLRLEPTKKLVDKALEVSSPLVTLCTVEGTIDTKVSAAIKDAVNVLKNNNSSAVAVRIEPEAGQAKIASRAGADYVEIDTTRYSRAAGYHDRMIELERVASVARAAYKYDMAVLAGGSLNYQTVGDIAAIEDVEMVSVGRAIIAKAVLTGLENAVRDMMELLR